MHKAQSAPIRSSDATASQRNGVSLKVETSKEYQEATLRTAPSWTAW